MSDGRLARLWDRLLRTFVLPIGLTKATRLHHAIGASFVASWVLYPIGVAFLIVGWSVAGFACLGGSGLLSFVGLWVFSNRSYWYPR